MRKLVIAGVVSFMFALPATARDKDKVDHIACFGGDKKVMSDVIRIVSQQVVNVMQVRNNDSLWDSNGGCHRGSVNREYTTDPVAANDRGVWGYHTAGEVILMLIPSKNPDSDTDYWWIRLEQIAYYPNQIVNGRNTHDQMAWLVQEIYDGRTRTPPDHCVNRKYETAIIIPISKRQNLNFWCDRFGWH